MPDLEISNLPALAEAGVAATDPLAIADISASETKKVTVKDLIEAGVALIDAASIPAAKVGTLGTDQVATGAIQDNAVTNAKLANSSISLGGISISLGGTDATPAFNLADATGYTTANLSGTISNAQLAGSIANSKLANSSVSFGGISLALGGTDTTPAFNLTDATGYKTTELVGTITNAQLAGSIDVSKLVGSTVSLGGVSVALGGTDATPAFNLTDATGYPASSLVGTVTNAQLAGSIANSKLANSSVSLGGISVALGASDVTPAFDLTDATNYPASSLTGTITNAQLAGSIAVSKLASSSVSLGGVSVTLGTADATPAFDLQDATGYLTSALVGTITNAQLAGSIAATKLVSGSITSTQLGANSVTDSELANNAVDTNAVQNGAITNDKVETSTSATTGLDGATKIRDASITPAKLNTSNLDRSLNVASGNLGINNTVTAATRSGITYNAQGLITGTVALAAADLPVATSSAVGGVSVGAGLSVSGAGALSLTNSVTGATVSGITFNAQGMITAATALVAGDLPVATTSAKGAVQITSGGGLTVDGSGNLTTSTSGVSAGTYQSVTVNNKGVITGGAALTAGLIPSLDASKITTGSIASARIANDSIDGSKLSNASTAVFQSIAQSGYPTAQFSGQILFDTVSEDAFIWDGNAWQAITTLTKGSLVFGGTFNANTSKMVSTTTAGIAAGLAVGSNLPSPSATTDGLYVVVDVAGTPSAPAPVVSLSPPDYILGVTNSGGSSWNEIDLSQTVAGQVASNITFTPYGQISATNVQDALQELETEKMGFAGGTVTGELLIGNTGSLVFEGSTVDAYELTLAVADPQSSDKTITFPDVTGTLITTGDTNTVTSTMVNGSLVNTNLAANAAIAFSKLAALSSAQILVGNGSNVPTAVAVTGDIGINNAGLTSITAGAIVNADISNSAAITGSKVTTGTTSAVGVLQLTNSAASTSTTTAATPAAVKTAKDAADAAATTANAALPTTGGTLTNNLIIDNGKELRLSESDGDGANYTGLKAQAQSGDITLTLPAVAPTAGQVLKANASTPTTLEWGTDSATDATKMPLAGGSFTGDVTFTGDSSNGLWDKSASAFVANLTGNVTGNASGSAATVTGAAQSAITSVGTLTGLTSSGDINLNAQADLRFKDADSSHYVALQSPASITSSFTLTLPSADAAVSGYVLASDGSGTLSWVDPGSSSSPTFTGDATLTNDGALVGFSNLNATYTGNTKTLTVTVASKTGAHRYNGSGSSSGYKIGGKESPFLTLTPGRTYKFDQADSSNSGHPLRFYLEADKTTAYTTGVTTNGTAGSSGAYTQIVVSDTTPQVLHYQCSAHSLMGNSVQTNSNIASTAKTLATARTIGGVSFDGSANINLPGVNAAGNQDTTGTSGGFTAGNASNLSSGTVNVARLGSGSSVTTKFLRGDNTWQTVSSTPEGTAILSTGESGGTKFLREDGDGTCSWQTATTSPAGSNTQIQYNNSGAFAGLSTLTTDGSDITFVGSSSKNFVWDTSEGELKGMNDTELSFGGTDGSGGLTLWDSGGAGYIRQKSNNCAIIIGVTVSGSYKNTIITDAGAGGNVECYYNGNKKFETSNTGVTITGTATATTFSGSGASLTSLPAAQLTGTLPASIDCDSSNTKFVTNTSTVYKSAGTIDIATNADNPLKINNGTNAKLLLGHTDSPYMTFSEAPGVSAVDRVYLRWTSGTGTFSIENVKDGSQLRIKDAIDFTTDGSTFHSVVHAGNVGSGGALSSKNVYVNQIHGSGANLTNLPASGGTYEAVNNGTITAGEVVIIDSTGKLKKPTKTITAKNPPDVGSREVIANGSDDIGYNIMARWDSVNRIGVHWGAMGPNFNGTNATNYLRPFVIGTGTPASLDYGTWYGPSGATTTPMNIFCVGQNGSLSRFVCIWRKSDQYSVARCFDTDGSTITWLGSEVQMGWIGYGSRVYSAILGICETGTTGQFFAMFYNGSSARVGAELFTVDSSGSVTRGNGLDFAPNGGQAHNINNGCCYDPVQNRILAIWGYKTSPYYTYADVIWESSGSLYKQGSSTSFNTPYMNHLSFDSTTRQFVLSGINAGFTAKIAMVGIINSSSITYTSNTFANTGSYGQCAMIDPGSGRLCVMYWNGTDTVCSSAPLSNRTAGTYTNTTQFPFGMSNRTYGVLGGIVAIPHLGELHLFTEQNNSSNNDKRTAHIPMRFATVTSDLTATNCLGLAKTTSSNGATGTANVVGSVNTSVSGLTIGSKYYAQGDGTIAASADGVVGPVEVGLAVATNKILIRH